MRTLHVCQSIEEMEQFRAALADLRLAVKGAGPVRVTKENE